MNSEQPLAAARVLRTDGDRTPFPLNVYFRNQQELEAFVKKYAQPAMSADAACAAIAAIKPAAPEALAMAPESMQKWYRLGFAHALELAQEVASQGRPA